MANIDAIKRKLEELNTSSNRNQYLWKPKQGQNLIRIVPLAANKDYPFIELYFHYNIGKKKQLLSLATFDEEDPIVDFAHRLQGSGSKEEWKMGKNLEPKMRIYAPVIVRGEEDEGVKFWGFGKTVYKELLAIMADEDYEDITDLKNGRDIVVEFLSPKDAGNTYGQISVRVKPKQTPVSADKAVLTAIIQDQPDIYEIFKKPTKEELKQALDEWLNPSAEDEETLASKAVSEEDDEEEFETPKRTPKPRKVDDVDSAISELLGD